MFKSIQTRQVISIVAFVFVVAGVTILLSQPWIINAGYKTADPPKDDPPPPAPPTEVPVELCSVKRPAGEGAMSDVIVTNAGSPALNAYGPNGELVILPVRWSDYTGDNVYDIPDYMKKGDWFFLVTGCDGDFASTYNEASSYSCIFSATGIDSNAPGLSGFGPNNGFFQVSDPSKIPDGSKNADWTFRIPGCTYALGGDGF